MSGMSLENESLKNLTPHLRAQEWYDGLLNNTDHDVDMEVRCRRCPRRRHRLVGFVPAVSVKLQSPGDAPGARVCVCVITLIGAVWTGDHLAGSQSSPLNDARS